MRTATAAVVALCLLRGVPARADDLVAIKPGVMCSSASALAALTLPSGDSKTHAVRPSASDLALAQSGGCIDIPLGSRVTVVKSFRNTSIVQYGPTDSTPMIIPNVDYGPASGAAAEQTPGAVADAPGLPPGYRVRQRLPVGGPGSNVLEILEDRRITPAIRAAMWGYDSVPGTPDGRDVLPEFEARPALNAQVRLLAPGGAVLSQATQDAPLAELKPAGLGALVSPAFFLAVDHSAGTGSNGPVISLLSPDDSGLESVTSIPDAGGQPAPMRFASFLRSYWKVLPSRAGQTPEIIAASCAYDDGTGHPSAVYNTYRFRNSHWHVASRTARECDDYEVPPPRARFP